MLVGAADTGIASAAANISAIPTSRSKRLGIGSLRYVCRRRGYPCQALPDIGDNPWSKREGL
jgi:hypothetical protein